MRNFDLVPMGSNSPLLVDEDTWFVCTANNTTISFIDFDGRPIENSLCRLIPSTLLSKNINLAKVYYYNNVIVLKSPVVGRAGFKVYELEKECIAQFENRDKFR